LLLSITQFQTQYSEERKQKGFHMLQLGCLWDLALRLKVSKSNTDLILTKVLFLSSHTAVDIKKWIIGNGIASLLTTFTIHNMYHALVR
jgi:hypothetical protein